MRRSKGMVSRIGRFSHSAYSNTLLSPISARLTTSPQGMPSRRWLYRQLEVVKAKGRRFRDHENEIGPVHGSNYRTGGAWRRIDDGEPFRIRSCPDAFNQRRRHGLADPQLSVDKANGTPRAKVERPQLPAGLDDRPFRTDCHAAAAAVAKLLENEHLVTTASALTTPNIFGRRCICPGRHEVLAFPPVRSARSPA